MSHGVPVVEEGTLEERPEVALALGQQAILLQGAEVTQRRVLQQHATQQVSSMLHAQPVHSPAATECTR